MNPETESTELLFINADVKWGVSIITKLEKILNEFITDIESGDRVLIKTHFGQLGNVAVTRPSIVRTVVDYVRDKGGLPTVAETTGLGYGFGGKFAGRATASDYLNMAQKQGFTGETMNAPIIMLDGELGADTISVPINGEYIKRVEVARGLLHFDKVIMLTHAKGHPIGGIGGAIKNLGIGCVGKYSKGHAHFGDEPVEIDPEKCKGEECGKCRFKCPVRCISFENNVASIDHSLCLKCGHCRAVCGKLYGNENNAIKVGWLENRDEQAARFAENAKGVLLALENPKIPIYYLNLLLDVSPMCDCVDHTPYLMTKDIGILAGFDPLAIDQASVDMINIEEVITPSPISNLKPGEDKIAHAHATRDKDGNIKELFRTHLQQLETSERMGLCMKKYTIKDLSM